MAPQDRIRKFPLHPGRGHDPVQSRRVRVKAWQEGDTAPQRESGVPKEDR